MFNSNKRFTAMLLLITLLGSTALADPIGGNPPKPEPDTVITPC
ncbi:MULTISPECIES: hypothetical protein [Deinococcus]|uniref:Uncharacterized protein n=1 Tax=Deinococcus arenae TaxID=1452751 RepID=A0A8H9GSU7_9DEIO|nr:MULTISPECIES: hypothetical protein [Deinococcus]MDK2014631.1 hypothetical protein [Deinococcus sp. 43]GGM51683.1 hypothetical protein GCM10008956_29680 [Deinococcus arenae]